MPRRHTTRALAFLLLCALTQAHLPALARQTQTRPRRVNPENTERTRQPADEVPTSSRQTTPPPARPVPDVPEREAETPFQEPEPPTPAAGTTSLAGEDRSPADEATRAPEAGARWPSPAVESLTGREPTVRVGLATDARTAVITAAGRLISVEAEGERPTLIESARVRVEPRGYPPPPLTNDERDAEAPSESAALRTRAAGGPSQPGPASPKAGATTQRAGTSAPQHGAAMTAAAKPGATGTPAPKPVVRLTARLSSPTRGAAVFAADETAPRLDARGPVTFAPADEGTDFVAYGGKPYRGRIEVYANPRGTLTVVNVVGLEDYVRGVVPNELSPGGWPELEALKAQAVAARTYAVSNAGRFAAQGFDLLPTARSQVYGGRATEHPLSDRAVAETRGLVATHAGRPINALYTSTCGGRTEHAENIFGGRPVSYLRARECAGDHAEATAPQALRTTREPPAVRAAAHAGSVRDAALLAAHGLHLPARLTDEWLASPLTTEDARQLTGLAAALARQPAPQLSAEAARPAGFASALAAALDGESRAASLLNRADVDYLLSFPDAREVPETNRADVALLLRDGILRLHPDATLRPRQPLERARALGMVAAALGARALLRSQKGTARAAEGGSLVLHPAGGKGAVRSLKLAPDVFLFRVFGGLAYPAREVALVGGEPVVFHLSAAGEVDYLEVSAAPKGAAADRFSKYAHWSETMRPADLVSRLGRAASGLGELQDVRVRRRGASGRVLDLELVGSLGAARVTGGRVRTALGLREQLFVVEREHDEAGRVVRYTFAGRGWGHGVGMCQVGAYGMARAGAGYEKILKAYYTDIGLARLY